MWPLGSQRGMAGHAIAAAQIAAVGDGDTQIADAAMVDIGEMVLWVNVCHGYIVLLLTG